MTEAGVMGLRRAMRSGDDDDDDDASKGFSPLTR